MYVCMYVCMCVCVYGCTRVLVHVGKCVFVHLYHEIEMKSHSYYNSIRFVLSVIVSKMDDPMIMISQHSLEHSTATYIQLAVYTRFYGACSG